MLKWHYFKQGESCNFFISIFYLIEGLLLVCKGMGILEVGSKIRLRIGGHLCMLSVTKEIRIWGWWVYGKLKQETIRNFLGVDFEDSLLLCQEN